MLTLQNLIASQSNGYGYGYGYAYGYAYGPTISLRDDGVSI